MKTQIRRLFPIHLVRGAILLAAALFLLHVSSARAGLTMQIDIERYNYLGETGYGLGASLTTNDTPPDVSYGNYVVTSPGWPTNGTMEIFQFDTNGFNQTGGGSADFSGFDAPDFSDSLIQNITNGQWSIFVTNTVTTNVYHFTVTATIDSNAIPLVQFTHPANDATNVTSQPVFTWEVPTNYSPLILYGPNIGDFLPSTQMSLSGLTLQQGVNEFTLDTYYQATNGVVCSVPLDSNSNALSSWTSNWHVWDEATIQFSVGPPVDTSGTLHTLVAHYTWDTTNSDGSASGTDSSGNGNDLDFSGSFGAAGGVSWTTNAIVGPGAISFADGDGNSGGYMGWSETPTNVLAAIAGSFSIACWVNTTQNFDSAGDYAYNGAGIVSAYTGGVANDVIPLALTGGQAAFNTGGSEDDTLTSNGSVNDGNNHFVVVTRNQLTGEKIIYLDGVLDNYAGGTTNLLTDSQLLTIGAMVNATDPNAADAYYYNGYNGILDDLQIYSGVLSSNEVAYLYDNPGTALMDSPALTVTASATSGAAPLNVQFTSPSLDSDGSTVTNWSWDFGDGATSTEQSPLHTYTSVGTFYPTLVAYSTGSPNPLVVAGLNPIVVNAIITAGQSPSFGAAPLTVNFTGPITDSAGDPVTSWNWTFGDGQTSTSQSPSHTYASAGVFQPNLAVNTADDGSPPVFGLGPIDVFQPQADFVANLPGQPASFKYNNFYDATSLQLGGSAADTVTSDGPVLELTHSGTTQSGDAFSGDPVSLTGSGGFSTFFIFRLANGGSGIDNISFTLQGDSQSPNPSNAIPNSLSVVFYAFNGPGNNVSINVNGASIGVNAGVSQAMNNGKLWYAWVDYEGVSQDLEVRLSETPVRPLSPLLDTTLNIPAIIGTNFGSTSNYGTNNLLANGGFESEPDWGIDNVYYDGWATAMIGNEIPGWTIEPDHAATVHKAGGPYLTISGEYSINTDGEGYDGNNANMYQDFVSLANLNYQLNFNWQSWYAFVLPTTARQEVSVADTVTGAVLFDGLYSYDGDGPHPVHSVTANFTGTGNPLRVRIDENPQSGYNDDNFVVDDFSVAAVTPKYLNTFTGFTGTGNNEQDILAWKFTALPTSRITGTLNLTNPPCGFTISNSMVLMAYSYVMLGGITITNYVWVPVHPYINGLGQPAYESDPADLSPDALDNYIASNANGIDQADADVNQLTMLGDYFTCTSSVPGVIIQSAEDDADYEELENQEFDAALPGGLDEAHFANALAIQIQANPPPGEVPAAIIPQLYNTTAQVFSAEGPNGSFNSEATTYSLGANVGTVTARQQVLASPPVTPIILSPRTQGTNFLFDFVTVMSESYTVWVNTNLATTNWVSSTNMIGDGYVQEISVPTTGGTQSFFRLTSP